MADATPHSGRGGAGERIRLLTETYRRLVERWAEIERLSERERDRLVQGAPMSEVNGILRRKKDLLRETRVEEESVMGAREWWKRTRRSLPKESCRELLSLLDTISRKVERTLELEAECRARLEDRTAWGRTAGSPASAAPAAAAAMAAYGRGACAPARGGGDGR